MLPEGTAQRDVTVRDHRPYMGGFLKVGDPPKLWVAILKWSMIWGYRPMT